MPIFAKIKAKLRGNKIPANNNTTHGSLSIETLQHPPAASLTSIVSQSRVADAPPNSLVDISPPPESFQPVPVVQTIISPNLPTQLDSSEGNTSGASPQNAQTRIVNDESTPGVLRSDGQAAARVVAVVSSAPERKDLWKIASDLLDDLEKNKLIAETGNTKGGDQGEANQNINSNIDTILDLTDAASKGDKEKQWKAVLHKLVDGTMKAKSLIDAGLSLDPTKYGALAWGVVSFALQVAQNAKEIRDFVFSSSEFVVEVISRYAAYEALYCAEPSATPSTAYALFEEGVIAVYKAVLVFVGEVNHYLKEDSFVRGLKAFLPAAERTLESKKKEILSKDSALRDRLEVLRDECQNERFLKLQNKIDTLLQPIYRMTERLESIERFSTRMEREEILSWLPNAQMHIAHTEVRNKIGLENTGMWIFKEPAFKTWETSKSFWGLWLRGEMGTGKTVLTSGVINYMENLYGNTAQGAMAIYYCSGSTKERNTADNVLGSVARQLCETDQGLDLFQKWQATHSRNQLTCKALIEIICSLIRLNKKATTTIIVDALDELEGDHFQMVTDGLERMLDETNGLLKVFVSSRPDTRAGRMFDNWLTIDVSPEATLNDINAYIEYHVEMRLRRKKRVNEELKSEIKTFLREKAGGVFRYVEMALRWICSPETPRLIREAMHELPGELSNIYHELFLMIERDRPQNQQLARRIISWILAAQMQLNCEHFIDAVIPGVHGYAFDSTEEDILSVCHHLVVYNKVSDVFEFGHFSVNEFIQMHKQDEYSPQQAHDMCAWICLSIMHDVTALIEAQEYFEDEALQDYVTTVWEKSQKQNLAHLPTQLRGKELADSDHSERVSVVSSNVSVAESVTASKRQSTDVTVGFSRTSRSISPSSSLPFQMQGESKFGFPYGLVAKEENLVTSFYDYAFQFWPLHCTDQGPEEDKYCTWQQAFIRWFEFRVALPWQMNQPVVKDTSNGGIRLKEPPKAYPGTVWEQLDAARYKDAYEVGFVSPGDFETWLCAVSCIFNIPYILCYVISLRPEFINGSILNSRPALFLASIAGNYGIISILLREGAIIDPVDGSLKTPLCEATFYWDENMVEFLLEKGAWPNGAMAEIAGPLHLAASSGRPNSVEMLLKWGANHCARDTRTGYTAFREAVKREDSRPERIRQYRRTVKAILRYDHTCQDKGRLVGQTLLTDAIAQQDLWSVIELLRRGVSPSEVDEFGQTPLHKAAYLVSDEKFICLLLAAGAPLNFVDVYGWTALHCAASKLRVDIMELLMERGVNVLKRTTNGMTALDVAWSAVCDKAIYVNWESGELERWNSGRAKYVGPHDDCSAWRMPEPGVQYQANREDEESRTSDDRVDEPAGEASPRSNNSDERSGNHRRHWLPEREPKVHFEEKLRRFRDVESLWEDFVFERYGKRRNGLLSTWRGRREKYFGH